MTSKRDFTGVELTAYFSRLSEAQGVKAIPDAMGSMMRVWPDQKWAIATWAEMHVKTRYFDAWVSALGRLCDSLKEARP